MHGAVARFEQFDRPGFDFSALAVSQQWRVIPIKGGVPFQELGTHVPRHEKVVAAARNAAPDRCNLA